MKCLAWAAMLVMSGSFLFAAEAKPQYFTNVRAIQVAKPAQTNFIVIDPEIWSHARADLGDLRLYNGGQGVPYALRIQGNTEYLEQREVKVLNKGIVPDATQFLLDMSGIDLYDEITLKVNQRDFDQLATVEGANTPEVATWTNLAAAPIFDFTKHNLGSNLTIKLPPSNFRYLRVSISGKASKSSDVLPERVTGASACNTFRANAVWDDIASTSNRMDQAHQTVFRIELPKSVPIDRIHFTVPEDRINFRREVSVETRGDEKQYKSEDEGWRTIASGELSRVRSAGGKIHENLDLLTHDTRAADWRVTIQNGDDPALPLQLTAQSLQRRVYFDPHGAGALEVYYGDEKLSAPVYDYDKFFRDADATSAVAAQLGPGSHNADFSPRPDDRPWTERNNWVLWLAMTIAVAGIGAIALRGLRKA